jgi:hypothetical protein
MLLGLPNGCECDASFGSFIASLEDSLSRSCSSSIQALPPGPQCPSQPCIECSWLPPGWRLLKSGIVRMLPIRDCFVQVPAHQCESPICLALISLRQAVHPSCTLTASRRCTSLPPNRNNPSGKQSPIHTSQPLLRTLATHVKNNVNYCHKTTMHVIYTAGRAGLLGRARHGCSAHTSAA